MRSKKAGKAIAAGTFGCVFKPPIKCVDGRKGYEKGVSKLLTNKNAEEEMQVINNVMPVLSEIPKQTFDCCFSRSAAITVFNPLSEKSEKLSKIRKSELLIFSRFVAYFFNK